MCRDNKLARVKYRCCQLLIGYPPSMVNFVWFTDERN